MSANLADLNINLALIPGAFNQANQIRNSSPFLLRSFVDSSTKIIGNLWYAHSIFALGLLFKT